MAQRQQIHRDVQDAVIGWGAEPNIDAAAKHLARSRAALDAALVRQLVSEVAEVSIECVIDLLAEAAEDGGGKLTRVGEADLNPTQVDRLAAWVTDLPRTAEALGLTSDAYQRELGAAANRILSAAALNEDHEPSAGSRAALGAAPRVLPGNGNNAGAFVSQLAARLPKR